MLRNQQYGSAPLAAESDAGPIALASGKNVSTNSTSRDDKGNRDVPSVLLTPKSITKDNVDSSTPIG